MNIIIKKTKWEEHLNSLEELINIAKHNNVSSEMLKGIKKVITSIEDAALSQTKADEEDVKLLSKNEEKEILDEIFDEWMIENKGKRNYLKERMSKYEKQYFNRFIYPGVLYSDSFIKDARVFKILSGNEASYYNELDTFIFSGDNIPKKVVLHEMLHFYIDHIGDYEKSYLCAVLAAEINNYFGDGFKELLEILTRLCYGYDCSIRLFDGCEEQLKHHDMLFMLYSFNLDLQCGYRFGTVFGYGLDVSIALFNGNEKEAQKIFLKEVSMMKNKKGA